MLVLTRNVGANLMIGDNIKITVISIKGNQAKLGISAPNDVAVHREEIYKKIQEDKETNKLNIYERVLGRIMGVPDETI